MISRSPDNSSETKIKKLFLQTNPAMWFALGYIITGIIISIIFYERISFSEISLFTFIWTFTAVLIVFSLLNYKRFILLKKAGPSFKISNIYGYSIYQFLPYLIIAVIYEFLVLFSSGFNDYFNYVDLSLMNADISIFGFNPAVQFEGYYHPLAVEYFMIAYGLYLVYPYFYLLYLFQRNRITVLHRAILGQILALVVSFTCFIVFPAYGPRYVSNPEHPLSRADMPQFSEPIQGIETGLLKDLIGQESLYQLQFEGWNSLERVKTDCVPSMHVCLCLICLFYAVRYRDVFRWKKTSMLFWIAGVASLTFSTFYLRYHWLTDVVLGALLAVISYFATEKIYTLWLAYRAKHGLPLPEAEWLTEAEKLRLKN